MSESDIVGRRYGIGDKEFEVLAIQKYPAENVSNRYKEILKFRAGYLVAISYRGTLIPNITVDNGVVRIIKVSVNNKIYNRPGAISGALGINEKLYAYDIIEL